MKILYFHQYFSTPSGATGTRSYEFAKKLIDRGHEVTVVCATSDLGDSGLRGNFENGLRVGKVNGINVIEIYLPYSNSLSLPKRSKLFLKFAFKSIKIAYSEEYDLLFATSTPLTISIPGIIMRLLRPKKKFIFEVRDLWPELPKAMGVIKNPIIIFCLSVLEKISYLSMNCGVALSPGIQKGMEGYFSKKKKIELIPNGSDLDIFIPGTVDQKKNKELLKNYCPNILDGDFVFIFTGAHGIANGLDSVLDAAKLMLEEKKAKFVFVGNGKLKNSLMNRVKVEGLTNCSFLNPLPKIELSKLLQEADAGLMVLENVPAFYYGTSPNKFFDYISAGLPVVNNYPGWIADMIDEYKIGVAVKPSSPEEFAQAMKVLIEKRESLEGMCVNSRNLAESNFNRDNLSDRFVEFLERC